jgi:hypothetical protein
MIEHDVIVTLTPEDIDLYDRARAINLPTIVVSMYGDRIKMLLDEEREACAKLCDGLVNDENTIEYANGAYRCSALIRSRGQA